MGKGIYILYLLLFLRRRTRHLSRGGEKRTDASSSIFTFLVTHNIHSSSRYYHYHSRSILIYVCVRVCAEDKRKRKTFVCIRSARSSPCSKKKKIYDYERNIYFISITFSPPTHATFVTRRRKKNGRVIIFFSVFLLRSETTLS